jgi:two-component system chemotaxis response regulator CheB
MSENFGKKRETIRVLIVEDSPMIQKILKRILDESGDFEVVAIASNGIEAVKFSAIHNPDVISMDLLMPVMDGIEATRQIMQTNPVPIVIVSNIYKSQDMELAIKELEAGAVYILPKPSGPADPDYSKKAQKYRTTLRLMSEIKVVKRSVRNLKKEESSEKVLINDSSDQERMSKTKCSIPETLKIIAIGASAGGPEGLKIILSGLGDNLFVPVVIVQHIDPNFIEGFATWLNSNSKYPVKIAEKSETLMPGKIYVAPSGVQIKINKEFSVSFTEEKSNNGHIPSIDAFFNNLCDVYGKNSLAILLSGMGKDGAEGLFNLSKSGAYTFVQNEESSLVYGMPGEAVRRGAACRILSPIDIVNEINNLLYNYESKPKG